MSRILDGTGTNNVVRFALGIRELTYPKNLTLKMVGCTDVAELVPHEPMPWTGEGLPPVGTVCEIRGTVGQELRKQPSEWTEVEIIAHTDFGGSPIAVGRHISGETLGWGTSNVFRPIRTPEQIAADERDKAVSEMGVIALSGENELIKTRWLQNLYDAGYRKQPAP